MSIDEWKRLWYLLFLDKKLCRLASTSNQLANSVTRSSDAVVCHRCQRKQKCHCNWHTRCFNTGRNGRQCKFIAEDKNSWTNYHTGPQGKQKIYMVQQPRKINPSHTAQVWKPMPYVQPKRSHLKKSIENVPHMLDKDSQQPSIYQIKEAHNYSFML